jgi:hypothetical protein
MLVQALRARRRYWAHPNGSDDESASSRSRGGRQQHPTEDLPYKVELWDAGGAAVEVVLAVTASPSIGYAAFFAATREHPDRHITLRHKNNIVSRWAGGTSH